MYEARPSQDLSDLSAPAKHLRQILEHACNDVYYLTTVKDMYLTINQLKQRKEHQNQCVALSRLLAMKASKKIDQLLEKRTQPKKILQLLSQDDMPRERVCPHRTITGREHLELKFCGYSPRYLKAYMFLGVVLPTGGQ